MFKTEICTVFEFFQNKQYKFYHCTDNILNRQEIVSLVTNITNDFNNYCSNDTNNYSGNAQIMVENKNNDKTNVYKIIQGEDSVITIYFILIYLYKVLKKKDRLNEIDFINKILFSENNSKRKLNFNIISLKNNNKDLSIYIDKIINYENKELRNILKENNGFIEKKIIKTFIDISHFIYSDINNTLDFAKWLISKYFLIRMEFLGYHD